ncbi:MAG: MoxR family ATPase [Verrucomicrobiota bacterium]
MSEETAVADSHLDGRKTYVPREFKREREVLHKIRDQISQVVVGQGQLVEELLMALLCGGHVLIEGFPGLAKTLMVSTLSQTLHASFSRIQFTPDLLPGDLVGTLVFNPKSGDFYPQKGPIFCNILLADEINRSPAKVQSALLEAMQERQVTIGDTSYRLDEPFLVLATQNPIEQEGTYSLPEAQLDRFMFKLRVDYPTFAQEQEVMRRMSKASPKLEVEAVVSCGEVLAMRQRLDDVFLKEEVEEYILHLVKASRAPSEYGLDIDEFIRHGASPRASIFLAKAARARALIDGRNYVVPGDVKETAPNVLRHRVAVTYKAEAREMGSDDIVRELLNTIPLP